MRFVITPLIAGLPLATACAPPCPAPPPPQHALHRDRGERPPPPQHRRHGGDHHPGDRHHAHRGEATGPRPDHHPPPPPPEALDACDGLSDDAPCAMAFDDHEVTGSCRPGPRGQPLACVPDGPPPGAGPPPRRGVELGR